jgi:hypothetical protein
MPSLSTSIPAIKCAGGSTSCEIDACDRTEDCRPSAPTTSAALVSRASPSPSIQRTLGRLPVETLTFRTPTRTSAPADLAASTSAAQATGCERLIDPWTSAKEAALSLRPGCTEDSS